MNLLRRLALLWLLACCAPAAPSLQAGTIEGFTEPYRRVDIAPSEPGILASIDVEEGDTVRSGQQLAALEADVLRVALQIADLNRRAQGRFQAAQAELQLRHSRLDKLEELKPRGHASAEEVQRARTDLQIAEAALLAAKEQGQIDELEYVKTQALIERRIMRSPLDGVVTRVYREPAEFVTLSNPTVMTVVQLHPLRATFSVPTAQAIKLEAGQSVALRLPELQTQVQGKVELVSPVTEAESGTVRVKVLLDNSQNQYRSGIRCLLEVDVPRATATVPAF